MICRLVLLLLPMLSCNVIRKSDKGLPTITQIRLSNFPSRDTSSITFMRKNDVWSVVYVSRNLTISEKPPLLCKGCDSLFTAKFLSDILTIKDEVVSKDCTITIDTLINGEKVVSIDNFYNHTNLREETISVVFSKEEKAISYFDPRRALRYCQSNADRLRFIQVSDKLRSVR